MVHQIKDFKKYLELLGADASEPSIRLLEKIVKAHLIKIPFENISKLLYKKEGMNYIPPLEDYLYGIENYNFGGTCYANNYYLFLLLKHLGFNVKLCGADMKNPDVHLISIVRLDEDEYIVDAGYAAPFFNPVPRRSSGDIVIPYGNEKYIIKPVDEKGRTRVEQYCNGKLQHWYTAKPQPRRIDEFRKVIEDSYRDDATFMNALRITGFSEKGSLVLKNLKLTETNGLKSETTEFTREEISSVVRQKFGMPEELVHSAVSGIKELKDIYD